MTLRPMRSVKATDTKSLPYPVYASPKLDGIRALAKGGVPLSRTLKKIPNRHVQSTFDDYYRVIEGLDGELIVGDPTAPDVYRVTDSAVMTHSGQPDFSYYVFDIWDDPDVAYCYRADRLREREASFPSWVKVLSMVMLNDEAELLAYEDECLDAGYEGIMIRNRLGRYKYGQSTLREAFLLKLKRFEDMEAEIVGFTELMRNDNEAKTNELGRTQRSTAAANMTPMNRLGNFIVRGHTDSKFPGVEFEVGSGFTQDDRIKFWKIRDSLLGKFIKVKYFERGILVKPRFPTYLGFRSKEEM